MLQRPVSVVEAERPSRLCVLIIPILPGAIHRDHAGEILTDLALTAESNPELRPTAHHLIFSLRLSAELD